MMTAPISRPRRVRRGLSIMAESNLRASMRILYCEQCSWIAVTRALRMRRATVESFYYDERPGTLALARAIATATNLALEGRFVVTERGVKAIGGKP